jgi:hypothetical protein
MTLAKRLTDVTAADLEALVESQAAESKYLDFKLHVVGQTDSERREFLADVSSFANALGGQIVFGIGETDGKASELQGLEISDPEREILRLEAIARTGISPRIPGLALHAVALSPTRHSIIVRVPRSWLAPHMVNHGGITRFFTRTSAGKHQMDIEEIRQAFVASDALIERLRAFRFDRLSRLSSSDDPMLLQEAPLVVIHVLPINSFQSATQLDMKSLVKEWHRVPMLYGGVSDYRLTFDGLLVRLVLADGTTGAYTLLFRNGAIETVNSHLLEPQSGLRIPALAFEQQVIEATSGILSFLNSVAIEPPFYVFLSLLRVRGYAMFPGSTAVFMAPRAHLREIDREDLILPEVILDAFDEDVPTALRPAFDVIWNASGWPGSPYYDEDGNRKP